VGTYAPKENLVFSPFAQVDTWTERVGIWVAIILFGGFVTFTGFVEVPSAWAVKAIWLAICGTVAIFAARLLTGKKRPATLA